MHEVYSRYIKITKLFTNVGVLVGVRSNA